MSSTETIIIALALVAIIIGHVLISRRQLRNQHNAKTRIENAHIRNAYELTETIKKLQWQLASEIGRTKALNKKLRELQGTIKAKVTDGVIPKEMVN